MPSAGKGDQIYGLSHTSHIKYEMLMMHASLGQHISLWVCAMNSEPGQQKKLLSPSQPHLDTYAHAACQSACVIKKAAGLLFWARA